MGLQELCCQNKLRIQKLFLRRLVDNGDQTRLSISPRGFPFGLEHIGDLAVSILRFNELGHVEHIATGAELFGCKQVEKRSTRVGVDFNQFRAFRCHMKIITHEDAVHLGGRTCKRDVSCIKPISGSSNVLHCRHKRKHGGQISVRDVDRRMCEQVRM